MFTLVAYDDARAAAVAALAPLLPAPDQHVTIDGLNIVVPEGLPNVIGVYVAHGDAAIGGAPLLAELQSPALRALFQHDLDKMHDTIVPIVEPLLNIHPESPIPLDKGEGLQAWMANGVLAAARGMVGVLLSDGPQAPVKGPIQTIRFTTVTPVVADVWSLGVLTVIQPLPTGKYQVVGVRCVSADVGLFRLIFTDGKWRPGGVITTAVALPDIEAQRHGNLGVWGEFDSRTLPRLEILSILAVANPDIYLDLIKVG